MAGSGYPTSNRYSVLSGSPNDYDNTVSSSTDSRTTRGTGSRTQLPRKSKDKNIYGHGATAGASGSELEEACQGIPDYNSDEVAEQVKYLTDPINKNRMKTDVGRVGEQPDLFGFRSGSPSGGSPHRGISPPYVGLISRDYINAEPNIWLDDNQVARPRDKPRTEKNLIKVEPEEIAMEAIRVGGSNFSGPVEELSNSAATPVEPAILANSEINPHSFTVDSMISYRTKKGQPNKCGVIRWIGYPPPNAKQTVDNKLRLMAGIELEEATGITDGSLKGVQYFRTAENHAMFMLLDKLLPDPRFSSVRSTTPGAAGAPRFGGFESPLVAGNVPPPPGGTIPSSHSGMGKGIQGHHNSCYLDATLFAMFAFTGGFDSVVNRPDGLAGRTDGLTGRPDGLVAARSVYKEAQELLKFGIINPLRETGMVSALRVMNLRDFMDRHGSVGGMTSEEKDPEEFLTTFLHKICRAEPFIKLLTNGRTEDMYMYQVFMDRNERIPLPSTQQLLEQAFFFNGHRLSETPKCFIMQVPRYGKGYKLYDRVLPSLWLNISELVEGHPRCCDVCGKLARYSCAECSSLNRADRLINKVQPSFCRECFSAVHSFRERCSHVGSPIAYSPEFLEVYNAVGGDVAVSEHLMELRAVVCIETSHYVAYAKCGDSWCLFDSMADRRGDDVDGYNVPEVTVCPELGVWLADHNKIVSTSIPELPKEIKRITTDAYICFYVSPDLEMFL